MMPQIQEVIYYSTLEEQIVILPQQKDFALVVQVNLVLVEQIMELMVKF